MFSLPLLPALIARHCFFNARMSDVAASVGFAGWAFAAMCAYALLATVFIFIFVHG